MDIKGKIALLFETTYSAKTTEELINAQNTLESSSKSPEFLRVLFEILMEKHADIDLETKKRLKAVKKAATIFLKKIIDSKLEEESIKNDELYYLADLFCQAIYSNTISKYNKNQFMITIHNLILHDLSNYYFSYIS